MNKIELSEVIEYYKTERPQLKELLNSFYSIFKFKERYINRINPNLSISEEITIEKLESGKYIMEETNWVINREIFQDITMDLIELLVGFGQKLDTLEIDSLKKLFSIIPDSIPAELSKLIEKFRLKEKEINSTKETMLNYILLQALSIFYRNEADRFKDINYQLYWTKSICPVCGNVPKISRLLKDSGRRMVACFLCWTEWIVPRIGCVYCGNNFQGMLKYFYADGNKAYRSDVCDVCKKYIKTIDERTLNREVIMELEDNITYHLDTLAINEGYKNPFL